jgi:hypothetical protein
MKRRGSIRAIVPRGSARAVALALALLLPATAGCFDQKKYEVTAPNLEAFLSLAAANNATSLPADGVSRLVITATISPAAAAAQRTLTFSTTSGQLFGGTEANGSKEVVVDSSGQAQIELQSALQVGRAQVRATVNDTPTLSRTLEIDFTEIDPDDIVRFVAAPGSAPADGATLTSFTVTLSPLLAPADRMVQFRTDVGTFAGSGTNTHTVAADGGLTATAQLKSPATLSTGLVSATAGGVTRQAAISFERALPSRIAVSTDKFQVMGSSADKVTLTATLERDIGAVTENTPITLSMRAADGTVFGLFRNVTSSNSSGQATADFVPGDTTFTGQVTLTVGVDGRSVTGEAVIEIIPP